MAVSKVLHGRGANVRVGAETAEHIRRIATDLRYQPNHLARSFRNQKTNTIGLVFEHFQRVGDTTGYFSQLLNGVMSATFPLDYSLTICPKLIKLSNNGMIFDGRFDGIVWCKPDISDATLRAIEQSHLPIVLIHVPPKHAPAAPLFYCDNEQGLKLAVQHLADLGHQRIAFAVDYENEFAVEARERADSFAKAKLSLGLSHSVSDLLVWDHDAEALHEYWQSPDRHTAIIAFSESQAVHLLLKARALGIAVPDDLSVIGFDSTSFCETTTPRLTSISQPVEQMAFDATRALISTIEERPRASQQSIYSCGLDIRESTACPSTSQKR